MRVIWICSIKRIALIATLSCSLSLLGWKELLHDQITDTDHLRFSQYKPDISHFYIIGNSAFLYSDGSRPLWGFTLLQILFRNKQPQAHFHLFVSNGASQKQLLSFAFSSQWSLRTEYWFAFAIFHFLALVVCFFILPQAQLLFLTKCDLHSWLWFSRRLIPSYKQLTINFHSCTACSGSVFYNLVCRSDYCSVKFWVCTWGFL